MAPKSQRKYRRGGAIPSEAVPQQNPENGGTGKAAVGNASNTNGTSGNIRQVTSVPEFQNLVRALPPDATVKKLAEIIVRAGNIINAAAPKGNATKGNATVNGNATNRNAANGNAAVNGNATNRNAAVNGNATNRKVAVNGNAAANGKTAVNRNAALVIEENKTPTEENLDLGSEEEIVTQKSAIKGPEERQKNLDLGSEEEIDIQNNLDLGSERVVDKQEPKSEVMPLRGKRPNETPITRPEEKKNTGTNNTLELGGGGRRRTRKHRQLKKSRNAKKSKKSKKSSKGKRRQ